VNRGQRDIDADLSIRVGLRNEERFFRTHPVYSRDRSINGKCGTMNLARNLNGILIHHIRECLPELKIRIANMMGDVQSELDALGMPEGSGEDPGALGGKLLGLLSKFSANFAAMIDGRASNTNQHHDGMPSLPSGGGVVGDGGLHGGINMGMGNMNIGPSYNNTTNSTAIGANADELYGGARISHIFHQVFGRSLNSVGAFDGLSEDEIRTTIGNANGTRPACSYPKLVLTSSFEGKFVGWNSLVSSVSIWSMMNCKGSQPSPNLRKRDRMMDVVSALLKRSVGPTQMWVSNLVRIELSYINTNRPDFIGGSRAVARLMEKMATEKEIAARQAAAAPMVNDGNQSNGGNNNTMTPVKERPNTPNVGATPLSSSSLEKYMAADDGNSSSQHGAPPQHVVVDRSSGAANNNGDGGGIMNFIFRGNNTSNSSVGVKRSDSWNNRGMAGNMRSNNSHYSNSGSAGGGGGPPTIVQLPQVPDTMRQTDAPPSDRERVETEIIKSLIDSYFSIVRKNYIDMVPKTIMYFLVNHVKDELQNELVSELYREAEVGFLMKEAEDIALRRRTCLEMRDLLQKALEIVNEVRDFNTFAK
ncbi:hypothetical protein ACHAXR_012121, partial [Thalassiosira sp. AJA248-18]